MKLANRRREIGIYRSSMVYIFRFIQKICEIINSVRSVFTRHPRRLEIILCPCIQPQLRLRYDNLVFTPPEVQFETLFGTTWKKKRRLLPTFMNGHIIYYSN